MTNSEYSGNDDDDDDDDDNTDVGDTIRNSNRCQSCTIGEGIVT